MCNKYNSINYFFFFLFVLTFNHIEAKSKTQIYNYYQNNIFNNDSSKLKVISLEDVVISAQISPKVIDDVVHNVQTINRRTINQLAAKTLQNLFTQQSNTRLTQDNILGSSASIQGLSGQNIKILIDGIPLIGRLNGNIDLGQINLNSIEKVEIIEGPMSVNFGSDALAGSINLISRLPQKNETEINSYYESVGQYNVDILQTFNIKPHFITFVAGRNYFDGWSNKELFSFLPKKTLADESRFKEWKPKEQLFLNGAHYFKKSNFDIKTSYSSFNEKIINRGSPREPLLNNAFDDYYLTQRNTFSTVSNYDINQTKINISLSHADYRRIKNTYFKDLTNLTELLSSNSSDHDTSKFTNSIFKASFNFPSKKSIEKELGIDLNFESAEGRRIKSKKQNISDFAIFSNVEWRYKKKLVVRPGIRYSYNTNYKSPLVPSVHLKYKFKNYDIRLSFAKGFRAPSLKEQYFDFVDINHNIIGNEYLNAESSKNKQVSLSRKKVFINKAVLEIKTSLFHNNLTEMITLASLGNQQYQYINVGEYKSKGIRTNTSYSFLNKYSINYSFYCLGRNNQISENDYLNKYVYSFDHSFSITKTLVDIKADISLFYKLNGKLPSLRLDTNGQVQNSMINGYGIMDLSANKVIKRRLNLVFGCKNLFNIQSIESINFSSNVHQSNQNSLSIAYGRSFFISLNYKIK